MNQHLNLWVPDGHLQTVAVELLIASGLLDGSGLSAKRKYELTGRKKWLKARLARPPEIAVAVGRGEADVGICGADWVNESGSKCVFVLDLGFGNIKIKLLVPKAWSEITNVEELLKQKWESGLLVWSEFPLLTRRFFENLSYYKEITPLAPNLQIFPWFEQTTGSQVTVRLSFGKTEAKNISADIVDTALTAEANGKKAIATVLKKSTAWFIASRQAMEDEWKSKRVKEIAKALQRTVQSKDVSSKNESRTI